MKRRLLRVTVPLLLCVLACFLVLGVLVALTPFPEALRAGPMAPSLRVLDRAGRLIAEVAPEGRRAAGVDVEKLPPHVVAAVLAAEDARFFSHPGVDALAVVRALGQAASSGRWGSGASTITQQLARNVVPRPRTLRGKAHEMLVALRIERALDKPEILEEYLSRIEFGPRLCGLEAASRALFDKPADRLDLAEAALLAGLPRGPSLYDPTRGVERAKRRRDRILGRMLAAGSASREEVERATAQPIVLNRGFRSGGAEHLVRALDQGKLPEAAGRRPREVVTTLDLELQAEVEALARSTAERLRANDGSAAAVLVVDNETREVLAYVGSPDFWSERALGQNDGVRALRQPGSALKPFVYAAAIEALGYTAATLLPDVELHFPTQRGDYSPKNYDGRFHGPVRLRQALASSLNVPAVFVAERTGHGRVLSFLHRVGFASLDEGADEYGAAIALGDGEVTLAELANAYVTLAQGGRYAELRYVQSGVTSLGQRFVPSRPEPKRAMKEATARLVTDLLSDEEERQAGFGRNSVLSLPYPVAVKTGTSKGYRDNWTVGFSAAVTVAVWVGNFDGHPMRQSSGVTGAGPLFHDVMEAAMRGRPRKALPALDDFSDAEICPLSGELPGPDCPHRTREHFATGTLPRQHCTMHERVSVVPSSGLRRGPACSDGQSRPFERYTGPYLAWAKKAGRPLAPERFDPRCPGRLETTPSRPTVAYPLDGARFTLDPALSSEQQRIVLAARYEASPEPLWFVLDGKRLGPTAGELPWQLSAGRHVLHVEAPSGRSEPVRFEVQ